jgi:hypothetical protein
MRGAWSSRTVAVLLALVAPGCFTTRGQFTDPHPPSGIDGGGGGSGEAGMQGSGGGTGGSGGPVSMDGGSGGTVPGTGGFIGPPGDPVTGKPGVWENVTPAMINLSPDYPTKGQNFGAQDVLADPAHPGTFYAFVCFQGVWKSTNWGASWSKVSKDGNLEKGKPWGEAIAPDGSYMLAAAGNYNGGAWRSTDGGATWTSYLQGGGNDPYMFDIDPRNKNHVISTTHSTDIVYESNDGGVTWMNKGSIQGGGISGYVFFITSTTWLVVSQSGSNGTNGTRRTTNSGASWTKVGNMEHLHGGEQLYIDPTNGAIYLPSEGGVFRSTNQGASFAQVSQGISSSIFATGDRIYAMRAGATGGFEPPTLQRATRANGTDWAPLTTPPNMTNGAKRAATMLDQNTGKWVIVGGHWLSGFWRLIEE